MRGGSVVVESVVALVVVISVVVSRSPRHNTPASWSCRQTPLLSWNGQNRMLSSLPSHCTARRCTVRFDDVALNRFLRANTALARPLHQHVIFGYMHFIISAKCERSEHWRRLRD